ncbi:hypothetical protein KIH87_11910 [Paraneptunicella aestuarii]|uniref:DUF6932 family protein n=1 Tax=Paraneptunicella aestuarii TaxID=2831148 RepID=UPI001E4E640D|nr:hypothetical protein [Paraneptunicella aestuarii]UAA37419.1 hypothetical protein KIH87_11910 [Paraneptunicella aestuarii]
MSKFNTFGTLFADEECSTKEELLEEWGTSSHRRKLINDFLPGLEFLFELNVETVYLAGSFASIKEKPSDVDGVFLWSENVDESKLSEDLLEILEDKYRMDFYLADMPTEFDGKSHIDFFREGRNGEKPGLIKINLKKFFGSKK